MKMKKIGVFTALSTAGVFSSVMAGTAGIKEMTIKASGVTDMVVVRYVMEDAAAVVTMDVETNFTIGGEVKWASIGGRNLWGLSADSPVFRKIQANSTNEIVWSSAPSAVGACLANGSARVRLRAWPLDNTPDYLVADISENAEAGTERYYPSVEFLPGGLFNPLYRTTMMVFKRVHARGVPWMMGSTTLDPGRTADREVPHAVTLDGDYYLGVFQLTQAQYGCCGRNPVSLFTNAQDRDLRPCERLSFSDVRDNGNSEYYWPNDPYPKSVLGILRARTGLDCDLPSEAQWEYACRAGHGDNRWGNGAPITSDGTDANLPGRYRFGGGLDNGNDPSWDCPSEHGTAIVGSYPPNDWGFYDMHGNVFEWCLDWWQVDISGLGGAVNVNKDNPSQTISGAAGSGRVTRGGCWASYAMQCRSAYRDASNPTQSYAEQSTSYIRGIRVICKGGLK